MPQPHRNAPQLIIVGAGPVGLCLANLTARAGIETLVLEAEPAIATDLRASTFHPPTLDMLETLDVTKELLAKGLICPSGQIRLHPRGERAVFDMSVLAGDTRHPYRVQCEQWKLALALCERLRHERQAALRFSAKVVAMRPGADRVEIDIAGESGHETLAAPFVVACDGARSTVRAALDIPFEGVTDPETTILATTRFPFEEHLDGLSNVTYCWKDDGNFSLLKVPGRWRVSIYPHEDLALEAQMNPAAIVGVPLALLPKSTSLPQSSMTASPPRGIASKLSNRCSLRRSVSSPTVNENAIRQHAMSSTSSSIFAKLDFRCMQPISARGTSPKYGSLPEMSG